MRNIATEISECNAQESQGVGFVNIENKMYRFKKQIKKIVKNHYLFGADDRT